MAFQRGLERYNYLSPPWTPPGHFILPTTTEAWKNLLNPRSNANQLSASESSDFMALYKSVFNILTQL